jgi:hypothetical protein
VHNAELLSDPASENPEVGVDPDAALERVPEEPDVEVDGDVPLGRVPGEPSLELIRVPSWAPASCPPKLSATRKQPAPSSIDSMTLDSPTCSSITAFLRRQS